MTCCLLLKTKLIMRKLTVIFLMLLSIAFNSNGQSILTDEFLVNSAAISEDQKETEIAVNANGEYVVVWSDASGTTNEDIYARVFDADGTPISGQISVNDTTTGRQWDPGVGIDNSGNIVVVWSSQHSVTFANDVYFRRFNKFGVPLSGDSLANITQTSAQRWTAVAMAPTGEFAIAWAGNQSAKDDIYFQLFNSSGTKQLVADEQVNTIGGTTQDTRPDIAMKSDGEFSISWQSTTGGSNDVYVASYNAAGVKDGVEISVDAGLGLAGNDMEFASIGIADDGRYTVTLFDQTTTNIRGALFDNSNSFVSGGVINTTALSGSTAPMIAVNPVSNEMAILWTNTLAPNGIQVLGQKLDATGAMDGVEIVVNTTIAGDQSGQSVGYSSNGYVYITYNSPHGGDFDIYSKILCTPPSKPTGVDNEICSGENALFTASGAPVGGTYKWYTTGAGGVEIATGQFYGISNLTVNTTLYVSAVTANGCESIARDTVDITMKSLSVDASGATLSFPSTFCSSDTISVFISSVVNASQYNWTTNNTAAVISGDLGQSISLDMNGETSTQLTIQPEDECGNTPVAANNKVQTISASTTFTGPAVSVTGPSSLCQTTSGTFSISIPGASSYSWSTPGPATVTSGAGSASMVMNMNTATSTTVGVTAQDGCGNNYGGTINSLVVSNPAAVGTVGTITAPSNYCNVDTIGLSAAAVTNATSYSWSVTAGTAVPVGSTTGTSVSIDMNGSNTATVQLTATDACGGTNSNTINLSSDQTFTGGAVSVSGSGSLCQGSSGSYVITVPGASTFNWTASGAASISSGAGSSSIVVDMNAATTTTIDVTPLDGCGNSYGGTINSLVVSNPAAVGTVGTITAPSNYCNVDTIGLSAAAVTNATSYSWSVTAGTAVPVGSTTGTSVSIDMNGSNTATVQLTATDACGGTNSNTINLSSDQTFTGGAVSVSGSGSLCQGSSGSYVITVPGASTFNWTASGAASISSGAGSSSIVVDMNAATTTTIDVTPLDGCGNSYGGTINSLVVSNPAAVGTVGTITAPSNYCNVDTIGLSAAAVTNATSYSWSVTAGTAVPVGSTTGTSVSIDMNGSNTATVQLTATDACGGTNSNTINLSSDQTFTGGVVAIVGDNSMCQSSSSNYTISIPGAVSYSWNTTGAATFSGTGSSVSVSMNTASTTDITVDARDACGNSYTPAVATFTVVNPTVPTLAGAITGKANACENESGVTYTVAAVANTDHYVWATTTGTIVSGQGTNTIAIDFGTTDATVTVTPENSCNASTAGAPTNQAVTVYLPTPSISGLNASYDVTEARSLISGSAPTGGSFTATNGGLETEGANIYFNPGLLAPAPQSTSVRYTATDGNGCTGSITQVVNVTDGGSSLSGFVASKEYCHYDVVDTIIGVLPNPGTYTINGQAPAAVAGFNLITASQVSFNPTLLAPNTNQDTTYTIVFDDGIVAPLSVDLVVQKLDTVSFTFQPEYCESSSSDLLQATSPTGGVGSFTSTLSGGGLLDLGKFANLDPSVFSDKDTPINITYTYTSDRGCIQTKVNSVIVHSDPPATFNPIPTIFSVTDPDFTITGSNPTYSAIPGAYTTTFTSNPSGAVTGNIISPSTVGVGDYNITYTVIDNTTTCTSTSATSAIKVILASSSIDGIDPVYCQEGTTDTLRGIPDPVNWDGNLATLTWNFTGAGSPFTIVDDTLMVFDPSSAPAGTYDIEFSFVQTNSNVATVTRPIIIDDALVAGYSGFNVGLRYCEDVTDIALTANPGNLPAGGVHTWSGPNGVFSSSLTPEDAVILPSVVGNSSSPYSLTYRYTSTLGCFKDTTTQFYIDSLSPVSFTISSLFNATESAVTLTGTPASGALGTGSFTIDGSPATQFDPSALGSRINPYNVEYTFVNNFGCESDTTIQVTVTDATADILGVETVYCKTAQADTLEGVPDPNTWDGDFNQVSWSIDNSPAASITPIVGTNRVRFDASLATSGIDTIRFTYRQTNTNFFTVVRPIVIDEDVTADYSGFNVGLRYCEDVADISLTANPGNLPVGGTHTWSGPSGVFSSSLTPEDAVILPSVVGNSSSPYSLTYRYTSTLGCFKDTTTQFYIDSLTPVSFSISTLFNSTEAAVTLLGTPASGGLGTGAFTIDGSPATQFDPGALGASLVPYRVEYTFDNNFGCTSDTTILVTVTDASANLLGIDAVYCQTGRTDTLQGIPDPNTWDGDISQTSWTLDNSPLVAISPIAGTTNAIIDPSLVLAGTDTVRFTYRQTNTNFFTISKAIIIDSVGNVTISNVLPTGYCVNAANVTASVNTVPGAVGTGVFTGPLGVFQNTNTTALLLPDLINVVGGVSTTYKLKYEYTRNFSQCTAADSVDLIIHPLPTPLFTINSIYQLSDDSVQLIGTPIGGTFSGQGITSVNYFDPGKAGAGGPYNITYSVTDINGCSNDFILETNVSQGLSNIVSKTGHSSRIYCYDEQEDTLFATTLNGNGVAGTFDPLLGLTSIGDSSFTFNPAIAGQGTHKVTYRYRDINNVDFIAEANLVVDSIGLISFNGLSPDYCADENVQTIVSDLSNLTASSGLGGSGAFFGSSSSVFDGNEQALFFPTALTPNAKYPVDYIYTSPQGCTKKVSDSTFINPLPFVFMVLPPTINVTEDKIPVTISPLAGTLSGSGINATDNTFDPAQAGVGTFEVCLNYTDGGTGCNSELCKNITVTASVGKIAGLDTITHLYCYDDPIENLSIIGTVGSVLNPVFSGPGITDGGNATATFDPRLAGPGVHDIIFKYNNSLNVNFTFTETITVDSVGPVSIFGLSPSYCVDTDTVTMVALTFGGGTNTFSFSGPALGLDAPANGPVAQLIPTQIPASPTPYDVTFTYTKANGCVSDTTVQIVVNSLPVVDFDLRASYNEDEFIDYLNPSPNPLGLAGGNGSFSITGGLGIFNSFFFAPRDVPNPGNYDLTYTYTDTNSCTNSILKSTNVDTASAFIQNLPSSGIYCYDETVSIIYATAINSNGAPGTITGKGVVTDSLPGGIDSVYYSPMKAGAGYDTIRYSYTDGFAPFSIKEIVFIDSVGKVSFQNLDSAYCSNDAADVLVPLDPSTGVGVGTFMGSPGLIQVNGDDIFRPDNALIGVDTITYVFERQGAKNCRVDTFQVVIVNDIPNPSFTVKQSFCDNEPDFSFVGTPSGGIFAGPVVQRNDTAIFTPNPNLVANQNIIRYEVVDSLGCAADFIDTVTVTRVAALSFSAAALDAYCADAGPQLFTGLIDAFPLGLGSFVGPGIFDPILNDGVTGFIPDSLASNASYTIGYTYVDANNCVDTVFKDIRINPLPVVSFSGVTGTKVYCEDEADLQLVGSPGFGFGQSASFTINTDNFPGSNIPMNLSNYIGTARIRYDFEDLNGCQNFMEDTVTVNPVPVASFAVSQNCIVDSIQFLNNTDTTLVNVVKWQWDFGDLDQPLTNTDSVHSPKHLYLFPGTKEIELIAFTDQGCTDNDLLQVNFGSAPAADFTWTNECLDPNNPQATHFTNLSDSSFTISKFHWDFGVTGINGDTSDVKHPSYLYSAALSYDVQLIIGTQFGCSDTIVKRVNIRPYEFLTGGIDYGQDFEGGEGGWFPETADTVISWEYGSPSASLIDTAASGSFAWVTQLSDVYENNESSSLVSPCFNLDSLSKPMITMNIWKDFDNGDGAVLQYTTSLNPTESDWTRVGEIGKGIEWYNGFGLNGSPGSQGIGWTDSDTGWVDARFDLDELKTNNPDLSYVRFRIAVGSDADGRKEGIGIDDIRIGERSKMVLIEHFTNSTVDALRGGVNDDADVNQFIFSNRLDIADIHYHTDVEFDELNIQAPAIPSARSIYYGFNDAPNTVMNGEIYDTDDWLNQPVDLEIQRLLDPEFNLEIIAGKTNPTTAIVNVVAKSDQDYGQVRLRIAIVEKTVLSGGKVYSNVVRDMLGGAPGTILIPGSYRLPQGDTTTYWWSAPSYVDIDNIKVVAFIQEDASHNVYQAATTGDGPALVGLDDELDENAFSFMLYPNPAVDHVTIMLGENMDSEAAYSLISPTGIEVKSGKIAQSQHYFDMNLQGLSSGVYVIRIRDEYGLTSYKKLVLTR